MKRRISSTLMALVLCLTLLPAAAYADGGTAVYVSSAGDDTAGNGSQSAPYATLAKAVKEAEDGATIYVMSDLTMTKCARYYDKDLTITSLDLIRHQTGVGDHHLVGLFLPQILKFLQHFLSGLEVDRQRLVGVRELLGCQHFFKKCTIMRRYTQK